MIDQNQLEAYLAKITQCFDTHDAHANTMRFMCRCLLQVQQCIPEIGQHSLDLAQKFWLEGKGQAEDLIVARVNCWNYLDAKGRSSNILDREDAAMRAVICVLYTEPDSDDFPADTVRWFLDMFDRLGDCSTNLEQFLII